MTFESDQTIDSLPKLIERLWDPNGSSHLYLGHAQLELISAYEGVDDDFYETISDFLDEVKGNTTVTKVEIYGYSHAKKGAFFPIINPLLKYLPNLKEVTFHVFSDSPVDRYLFNNAASVTTVFIIHDQPSDDKRVLELHPTLYAIEYANTTLACANTVIGPALLSLPFPSNIRELGFANRVEQAGGSVQWNDEMARPLTSPELNRLVEMIQLPSLVKLTLEDIRFSSLEECRQFAQGLGSSPVKDLCLALFTPDADNYRAVVSAFSEMPHLESLEATFHLDAWEHLYLELESFSIPLGNIVRGATGLKTLKIGQSWKDWDEEQCRDLAMAIQAPSCELKGLHMDFGQTETTMARAAVIMSAFSAPFSTIEEFAVNLYPFKKEEVDDWLSMLPRTAILRSLAIVQVGDGISDITLTELQEETFLGIVSGWYYLTDFRTFDGGEGFVEGAVEGFVECCLSEDCREQLETLTRLNKAGRRYLTSPTRSKADGVEVLVKVRHRVNDVYTHLLENPSLCDRGVETSARRDASPVRKKSRGSSNDQTPFPQSEYVECDLFFDGVNCNRRIILPRDTTTLDRVRQEILASVGSQVITDNGRTWSELDWQFLVPIGGGTRLGLAQEGCVQVNIYGHGSPQRIRLVRATTGPSHTLRHS